VDERALGSAELGWAAFVAARRSFLDALSANAALARLEGAWRLPAAAEGEGDDAPTAGSRPPAPDS